MRIVPVVCSSLIPVESNLADVVNQRAEKLHSLEEDNDAGEKLCEFIFQEGICSHQEVKLGKTIRIRPCVAVDLSALSGILAKSVISKSLFSDGRSAAENWGLYAALSPYSPFFHVMLLQSDANRYVGGPEDVAPAVGDSVFERYVTGTVRFLEREKELFPAFGELCMGYNWSPRSYGCCVEEAYGFQSMSTKWHLMMWTTQIPAPAQVPSDQSRLLRDCDIQNTAKAPFLSTEGMGVECLRLFDHNDYTAPLSRILAQAIIAPVCAASPLRGALFGGAGPVRVDCDFRGAKVLLRQRGAGASAALPGFFSQFLKPLADRLDAFFAALSDAVCAAPTSGETMQVLRSLRAEMGRAEIQDALAALRTRPVPTSDSSDELRCRVHRCVRDFMRDDGAYQQVRADADTVARFLVDAVRARAALPACGPAPDGRHAAGLDITRAWRRGFAYSLALGPDMDDCFHCPPVRGAEAAAGWLGARRTVLRVLPGMYAGAGGVVEALGIRIVRPENACCGPDVRVAWTARLLRLAAALKGSG